MMGAGKRPGQTAALKKLDAVRLRPAFGITITVLWAPGGHLVHRAYGLYGLHSVDNARYSLLGSEVGEGHRRHRSPPSLWLAVQRGRLFQGSANSFPITRYRNPAAARRPMAPGARQNPNMSLRRAPIAGGACCRCSGIVVAGCGSS